MGPGGKAEWWREEVVGQRGLRGATERPSREGPWFWLAGGAGQAERSGLCSSRISALASLLPSRSPGTQGASAREWGRRPGVRADCGGGGPGPCLVGVCLRVGRKRDRRIRPALSSSSLIAARDEALTHGPGGTPTQPTPGRTLRQNQGILRPLLGQPQAPSSSRPLPLSHARAPGCVGGRAPRPLRTPSPPPGPGAGWREGFRAGAASGGPARPRPLGPPSFPLRTRLRVPGLAAAASAPGGGGGASGHGGGRRGRGRGRRGRRGLELPGLRSEPSPPHLPTATPSSSPSLLPPDPLVLPPSLPQLLAPSRPVFLPPSCPPPQARSPSFRAGSSPHRSHPPPAVPRPEPSPPRLSSPGGPRPCAHSGPKASSAGRGWGG